LLIFDLEQLARKRAFSKSEIGNLKWQINGLPRRSSRARNRASQKEVRLRQPPSHEATACREATTRQPSLFCTTRAKTASQKCAGRGKHFKGVSLRMLFHKQISDIARVLQRGLDQKWRCSSSTAKVSISQCEARGRRYDFVSDAEDH
jgi:hypothetical protein